ncbi:hypothetical protein LguiB_018703 [Lonicera macranthoides]
MDEEYDVVVLGTGLKECILSGLLSVDGLKLWKRFRNNDAPPEQLGSSRDYNVDMIPKFMMANGGLVRVLIHTNVTKYLNFKAVDGSFVYNKGKIHKVPATDVEALKSPLMGLFEKRRARKFFIYVQDYEDNDPKSHEGLDLNKVTARDVISKYGLDDNTVDFIGHALALHKDDTYLDQPALDFVKRVKVKPSYSYVISCHLILFDYTLSKVNVLGNILCFGEISSTSFVGIIQNIFYGNLKAENYILALALASASALEWNLLRPDNLFDFCFVKLYAESLARFQGGSPYIYPLYGLGELPQAFARLSAVYGGTYMLSKPECKVEFDGDGKAYGVTSEGETAKCKKVVCDPSYLPNKVKKVGKVARAICIMSHPIPHTNDAHSVQVILPQKQLGRKSDMYLFCCSYSHNVAPKGKYIAFVTTEAETDNPETELKPGIELLGAVDEIFFDTYDRYEPTNHNDGDNCFISTSYDATTHFESTVQDVIAMYSKITGKGLDLSVDLSAASATTEE